MSDLKQYNNFFEEIVKTINSARYEAYKSLNKHHIGLNFEIGKGRVKKKKEKKGGKERGEKGEKERKKKIDGIKGYSPQNLWRMRQFYLEYANDIELLELTVKIPLGQNLLIMHHIKNREELKYSLDATDTLGLSRSVLLIQIKANAF